MINIEYSQNEGIRITAGDIQSLHPKSPYRVNIRKHVSGEIQWSAEIFNNSWATFPNTEMFDVEVTDRDGVPIYVRRWDLIQNGSIFYKSLWIYCKGIIAQGRIPKGIVIGTHDGEFGEWVPAVLSRITKAVLVEASDKQFEKLVQNYEKNSMVSFCKNLITPDGGKVKFFEGGEGYTNSVVEDVIRSWETEEITFTERDSISIDDLINQSYPDGFDWLHLDVEGLDADLIRGISDKNNLPGFIIFEDYNLSPEGKEDIYNYLRNLGYSTYSESGICQAVKM